VLRITIIETPCERKWVLQGRLIGPWAAELRTSWKQAHCGHNGQSCVVDLSDVTFIDGGGEKVLAKMMKEGAHFIVSGVYARHVVENLEHGRKGRSLKTFFLLVFCFLYLANLPGIATSAIDTGLNERNNKHEAARALVPAEVEWNEAGRG
jgi:hypothetical protein